MPTSVSSYLFVILACALAGLACGSARAQPAPSNNMLTAAGFVVKYPDTPEKQEIYNSLPPNRLVKRRHSDKLYYIYRGSGAG